MSYLNAPKAPKGQPDTDAMLGLMAFLAICIGVLVVFPLGIIGYYTIQWLLR